MSQLADLAKPWQARDVNPPPPGAYGDYVPHYVVEQKMLAIVGPHSFDVVTSIRGDWEGRKDDKPVYLTNVIVGCLAKLTCEIDGRTVTITEVGDVDKPANWKTDGARLKDAASDAYKRCCMRVGVGLHLYVKDDKGERYFLHDVLSAKEGNGDSPDGTGSGDSADQ